MRAWVEGDCALGIVRMWRTGTWEESKEACGEVLQAKSSLQMAAGQVWFRWNSSHPHPGLPGKGRVKGGEEEMELRNKRVRRVLRLIIWTQLWHELGSSTRSLEHGELKSLPRRH